MELDAMIFGVFPYFGGDMIPSLIQNQVNQLLLGMLLPQMLQKCKKAILIDRLVVLGDQVHGS